METEFEAGGVICPFVRRPLRIEARTAEYVVIDAAGRVIAKVAFGPSPGDDGKAKLSAVAARSVALELTRMLSLGDASRPPADAAGVAGRIHRFGGSRHSVVPTERLDHRRLAGAPADQWRGASRKEERHSLWKWVTLVAASIAMLRFAVEVSE